MVDYYSNYTSTQALSEQSGASQVRSAADHFRYSIARHFPVDKKACILDAACGYGRYLKVLAECGYVNVTGVDLSEEQIKYARENLGVNNAVCGDGLAYLEGNRESFDVILMMDILEHLETDDVINWLIHGREALKTGGVLIIQVPNLLTPVSVNLHGDFTHKRGFSVFSLSQALRLSNFSDFKHLPAYEPPYSIRGRFRMTLWKYMLNPALDLLIKIAYGGNRGAIYTANLLTVARKP